MKYPLETFFRGVLQVSLFLLSLVIVAVINIFSMCLILPMVISIDKSIAIIPIGGGMLLANILSVKIYEFMKFSNFTRWMGLEK